MVAVRKDPAAAANFSLGLDERDYVAWKSGRSAYYRMNTNSIAGRDFKRNSRRNRKLRLSRKTTKLVQPPLRKNNGAIVLEL
jgi:hypothetical protein